MPRFKRSWRRKRYGGYRKYRRYYRRPKRYVRRFKRSNRKYHHFKRAAGVTSFQFACSAGNPEATGVATFALNQVFSSSEFSTLFDAYRINCVVLKIYPDYGTYSGSGTLNPQWHVCNDYDDNSTPTVSQIIDYESYRTFKIEPGKTKVFKIYPACAMAAYRSGASWGFTSKRKQWIDMVQTDVPHYGFKFAVDTGTSGVTYQWRIRPFYYFSCRHVR